MDYHNSYKNVYFLHLFIVDFEGIFIKYHAIYYYYLLYDFLSSNHANNLVIAKLPTFIYNK